MKLFAFPYTAASGTAYNDFIPYIDKRIEFRQIELAGKGKRIKEQMYAKLSDLVVDVFSLIKDEISDSPYAFFGHSSGAWIAYDIAQMIIKENLPLPKHIFFCGTNPPHIKNKTGKSYYQISDKKLINRLKKTGNTSMEFFQYPKLVEMFLPIVKNEIKLFENYQREIRPMDVDITVLLEKKRWLFNKDKEWKNHTTKTCNIYYFNDDHMFVHKKTSDIAEIINKTLLK